MATQNRAQVGWIDCPMCETTATVHEANVGRPRKNEDSAPARRRYWRCECGAIQPRTETGQRYIAQHGRDMDGRALADQGPAGAGPDQDQGPGAVPAQGPAQDQGPAEGDDPDEYKPESLHSFWDKFLTE
jgi:hypothetical protein